MSLAVPRTCGSCVLCRLRRNAGQVVYTLNPRYSASAAACRDAAPAAHAAARRLGAGPLPHRLAPHRQHHRGRGGARRQRPLENPLMQNPAGCEPVTVRPLATSAGRRLSREHRDSHVLLLRRGCAATTAAAARQPGMHGRAPCSYRFRPHPQRHCCGSACLRS